MLSRVSLFFFIYFLFLGDIYVRYYGNLRRIAADNLQPVRQERTVFCFVGPTGTGKSRRAWEEAGDDAYPKVSIFKYLPN